MENPVMILGANGIGKLALDIFQSNNVVIYCFLDDDKSLHGKEIHGITVMGSTDDDGYLKFIGQKCEAFVATDDVKLRENLCNMLIERRKVMPSNCIHTTAFISPLAEIGHGNMISAGVIVNTDAKISSHCIVHSNAVIEYDAKLDDFVQVGAGSIINSGVEIGKGTFIGSGVTVVSGIKIGKKARIGAGSVVVENVKDGATIFGNPAKVV